MTIKAIETRYKGYRFRSRLEARWAVFFDALGVPYQYEPEGYDLGEAGRYLPDFLLWPDSTPVWFEVKGKKATADDFRKMQALCDHTGLHGFISSGTMDIPSVHKGRKGKLGFDGARIYSVTFSSAWMNTSHHSSDELDFLKDFAGAFISAFYQNEKGEIDLDHVYLNDTNEYPTIDELRDEMGGRTGVSENLNRFFDVWAELATQQGTKAKAVQKIDRDLNIHLGTYIGPGRWYRTKALKSAYAKARSARFEHGECG